MELGIVKAIASIILPPTGLIVLGVLGLGLSLAWKKTGLWLAAISLISLLLCSLPVVSALLINTLQTDESISATKLKPKIEDADALVLLAGGRRVNAEEYGDDTLSLFSLERTRYAAWVVKRTGLPLIISGGRLHNEARSEADLMREVLQKEFIVIVDHIEEHSRTTYENAKFTARFLKQNDLRKIALVTHAWHMPRAKAAFEHFDIEVIPAPTAFYGLLPGYRLEDFLPSASALRYSAIAFHEIFGHWWYELRYY
ncbi:YdcF family protein [Kaarinaea lacus]